MTRTFLSTGETPPADLLVIVPTRGRPDSLREFDVAWAATTEGDRQSAAWGFVFDSDDDAYPRGAPAPVARPYLVGQHATMVEALNDAAVQLVTDCPDLFAVGFCGDDHRMRTPGWNVQVVDALRSMGTGIVYCNDLIHGAGLATQVFMTADVVKALGYMAPPTFHHLYIDNVWMDWGAGARCRQYLPEVVVEHMHWTAGKAEGDATYDRVNATWGHDEIAYREYHDGPALAADVAKIRALRGA